jgi:nicotinamidase-related amidase
MRFFVPLLLRLTDRPEAEGGEMQRAGINNIVRSINRTYIRAIPRCLPRSTFAAALIPLSSIPRSNLSPTFIPSRAMSGSSSASTQPYPSPSLDPITPSTTLFFLCDIQETFRGKIVEYEGVIASAVFLGKVAKELGIPIVTTEQKPFKPTVKELQPHISPEANPSNLLFEKSLFSMITPEVKAALLKWPTRRHIVLFGIEAHVCVLQTALDLLRQGYQVHLVADGVSSQNTIDRDTALEVRNQQGERALRSC